MAVSFEALDAVPGFSVPVHRALTEPILLGGAPRSVAILNGTLAGAVGLGLQLWREDRRGLVEVIVAPGAAQRAMLTVGDLPRVVGSVPES